MLEAPAVVGHTLDSTVSDHLTALDTELLQVGTVLREHLEAHIGDITLANVQRPQSRA